MKNIAKYGLLTSLLYFAATHLSAYELATHAKMINAAYGKSKLGATNSEIQKRLGIDVWTLAAASRDAPFGDYYFALSLGQVFTRNAKSYEFAVMIKIDQDKNALKIPGWLMRGIIREDDGGQVAGIKKGEPRDDPYGETNRFCHHFLDPILSRGSYGRGFSKFCLFESPVYDAAQWALGSLSPFDAQPAENTSRRNHFTVLDARDLMWRALTLKDKAGADVPKFGFTPEELRKIYWASTFRSLGDVTHTLQDQAQPQHTRNEGHASSNAGYEEYIDARAKGSDTFTIDEQKLTSLAGQLPDLNYDGYAIPRFSRYSDYWSTQVNSANKFGMSDYSNRGFFTFEENFGNTVYAEPSSNLGDYTTSAILQTPGGASFRYLVGKVEDKVTGANDSITMSTQSIFSEMGLAGPIPTIRKYTLSKKNFDDRAALLIPRAVAYSAGLIDYFFRGELEIGLPDEGVYAVVDYAKESTKNTGGFNKVKLKLTNKTPSISPSGGGAAVNQNLDPSGTVVAIAKFRRNKCYVENSLQGEMPVFKASGVSDQYLYDNCRDKVEEIVVSDPVAMPKVVALNENVPLTFNFKDRIPINAIDLYLQVAYRGKLGDEADAVAVGTKDISEPTFIKISDYRGISRNAPSCNITYAADAALYSSPINVSLTDDPQIPFLVKAEINSTQYSMLAVISDQGNVKFRTEATPNKLDPVTTFQFATGSPSQTVLGVELDGEAQPEFGSPININTVIFPAYRISQFDTSSSGSPTLDFGLNKTIEVTNVSGMFIDFGFLVESSRIFSGCSLATSTVNYMRLHSYYPPYAPLVPIALKEVNF
jgi:hypothetical protein